jgi:hypothetical protein
MLFFLDIDGVMVPAKGWKSPELLDDGFPAFSNRATFVLRDLISKNDTIMLITSHKSNFSIEEWKNIFNKRDIQIENLKTLPENVNHLSRKDEIINWFNTHIVDDDFVIIDDDKSLNELPEFLKQHLVQTNAYVGLIEEHAKMVKSILEKGQKAVL